jgi:inosose dehydratase
MDRPEYGVDLITFFHPAFWGLDSDAAVLEWCREHPEAMWHRLLGAFTSCGTSRVEVTFPPLDFRGALTAFGSATDVRHALAAQGVELLSAFHDGTDWDVVAPEEAVAQVAEVVGFLQAVGAGLLVVGGPMLVPGAPEGEGARAGRIARFAAACDAVGASLVGTRVRLAVHTESHSIAVTEPDLRLLMASTDPELVGLCPDSAHLLLSGNDPVAVVREFSARVQLAHWKDAVGPFPADLPLAPGGDIHALHREYMRPLGAGAVDWPAWADALEATPAAGVRLLELDAAVDPVTELTAARRFVDGLRTSERAA